MELKDLDDDKVIKEKLKNLHDSVEKIKKMLDVAIQADVNSFSLKDRIDFDLFLTYALNTLYWMYLRTKGEDPNSHDVKNQLNRIKDYMVKAKQVGIETGKKEMFMWKFSATGLHKSAIFLAASASKKTPSYDLEIANMAHERQTIRPRVDQEAAGRFVKHGINYKHQKQKDHPPNKKIKFDD